MTDIQKESVLVWLRLDLRLADHPALAAAVATGLPVVPVFLWTPEERMGAAARWWLHQSLVRLDESLREKGSRLVMRRGPAAETLLSLAEEVGVRRVFYNRVYEPRALAADAEVAAQLKKNGIALERFNGVFCWSLDRSGRRVGERFRFSRRFGGRFGTSEARCGRR